MKRCQRMLFFVKETSGLKNELKLQKWNSME